MLPPCPVSVNEYGVPTVAGLSALVVICNVVEMVKGKVFEAVVWHEPLASVRVMVGLKEPHAVGVPEIRPVDGSMLSPVGRPDADHE